jgi:hypothetical protein
MNNGTILKFETSTHQKISLWEWKSNPHSGGRYLPHIYLKRDAYVEHFKNVYKLMRNSDKRLDQILHIQKYQNG